MSLQLAGALAEAEREFASALQRFPKDADLWFYLARVQYLQSSLLPAEKSARQSLALQPDHAGAHTQLAMILEALNDFPGALANYRRGIELSAGQQRPPTLPLVYAGNLLVKLNRLDEALDYFTKALAIDPLASELNLARGRVLEKMDRKKEAEDAYKKAVALDGNPQARAALERLRAVASDGMSSAGAPRSVSPIRFRNTASSAGLDFTLRNGATPRKYQVETMTGGVAVIDFDNDGWPDIYFINGAELPSMKKISSAYWNRLFRND
ncbi:MAG: tetratricopeptide repeat protein, partial [Blastocatellia bacterium]|nr:tetratricopeptide repeat protein [Blastocatellia bacterium]